MPGRNDPCPCGSGRKHKACCGRNEQAALDVVYMPQIKPALHDLTRRKAEFWRPLEDGRVACDLCYRRCEIEPSAAGWCKTRLNEGGRLALSHHGELVAAAGRMNGYGTSGAWTSYKPGLRGVQIGHTHCTAGCTFCRSGEITWRPSAIPWAGPEAESRLLPSGIPWAYRRGQYTPEQAVDLALRMGAGCIEVGLNEATLYIEYLLDLGKRAKQAGIDVLLDTNGFTTPAAIRALAPYVAAVLVGIKGSADPIFYERHMRSPGAVPHVLEALKTWKECGVYVILSDLIAPLHMQTAAVAEEHQRRLYAWMTEEIGPYTFLIQPHMVKPGLVTDVETKTPARERTAYAHFLLRRNAGETEAWEYQDRLKTAAILAYKAGMKYAYPLLQTIRCFNCQEHILEFHSPMLSCDPCTMPSHHCPFWTHTERLQSSTRADWASKCLRCGARTPIVPMTTDERRLHDQWRATTDPGPSKRTRVKAEL